MKKIIIDEALCTKIEALQYEVDARKEVISHVLSSGMKISTEQFAQYQAEYQSFYKQYNEAKQELINTYLGNKPNVSWNLVFKTRELTID